MLPLAPNRYGQHIASQAMVSCKLQFVRMFASRQFKSRLNAEQAILDCREEKGIQEVSQSVNTVNQADLLRYSFIRLLAGMQQVDCRSMPLHSSPGIIWSVSRCHSHLAAGE